jgi:phosphotransferase system  glucose/maltose/N-acetylglucosamine-specific IIC component
MLIGFSVAGAVTDHLVAEGKHDWYRIWMYPAVFAAIVMMLFALLFKNEAISYEGRQTRKD